MTRDLSGRNGIITGAGRGIGRRIAERCAADGMRVALVARTESELTETAREIEAAGGTAMVCPADVTDLATLRRIVSKALRAWERIDLLVNNAGVLKSIGPLWETDPVEWRADLEVNVFGVYAGCRAVVPAMMAAGGGRIVNMAGGGTHGPFPYVSAYAASKAAVMRLTENLAFELDRADANVKVFGLTPGFIPTGMTRQFAATDRGRRWMDFMIRRMEAGDHTTPDHAAAIVAAIARGELDAYHGRYLSAPDDAPRLAELPAEGARLGDTDRRRLRIMGYESLHDVANGSG